MNKKTLTAGIIAISASYWAGLQQGISYEELPKPVQEVITQENLRAKTLTSKAGETFAQGFFNSAKELVSEAREIQESFEKINPEDSELEKEIRKIEGWVPLTVENLDYINRPILWAQGKCKIEDIHNIKYLLEGTLGESQMVLSEFQARERRFSYNPEYKFKDDDVGQGLKIAFRSAYCSQLAEEKKVLSFLNACYPQNKTQATKLEKIISYFQNNRLKAPEKFDCRDY